MALVIQFRYCTEGLLWDWWLTQLYEQEPQQIYEVLTRNEAKGLTANLIDRHRLLGIQQLPYTERHYSEFQNTLMKL